ncbi:MAG: response regulator [Flavobacteriaceae bacterium]|nr:MAG: response regulator [Flavobacteriaceae bacterium]
MDKSKQLKIFVVDDEVFYLNILEQHIRNMGYENVTTFNNGTDCLNQITGKPDVVFLDYSMDTLTGYDVLKKIKRYDPNIYIVMISGQEDIKAAVDTLKHGAFDYIQKGDKAEEKIKHVLERILEVKALLKQSNPSFLRKFLQIL